MELTSNYKTGRQFVFVDTYRRHYTSMLFEFSLGIKFRDDLHPMFCPSYFSSHTSYLCLRLQIAHVLRYNIRKA